MSDLISRQAMLDGIDKLIKIHFDRTVVLYKARQVAENLPSVQPETNCSEIPNSSDVISRQQAIDKIKQRLFETAFNNVGIKQNIDETLVDVAENRLETWFDELPSAQPERKTGHWVEIGDEPYDEWECDVCGFVIDGSGCIDPEEYRDIYRFCPNCGADMRGEQDG